MHFVKETTQSASMKGGRIMKRTGKTTLVVTFSILCVLILPAFMEAADYPSKPIEFICGWAPGGVADTQSRVLCDLVGKILGQQAIVVTKAGASGAIAMTYVANQKPDGYTLCHLSAASIISAPFFQKVSYKPEDFTYIMGYGFQILGLFVRADSPWKTFGEFIDYAKKNPGKVKYSPNSPLSSTHIMAELIARKEGIDWTQVPQKGDGPCLTALLGGHVDAISASSGLTPQVRSGQIRLLAIFNERESKAFPGVPTLKGLGYDFPWVCDMTSSNGVIGPKGIKQEMVSKLEEIFTRAAKDSVFVQTMQKVECPIYYRSGKEFEAEVFASYKVFEKIIPGIIATLEK